MTLRPRGSNPFICTLAQTAALIDAIGRKSIGIVLDSFHWYTAGETAADLLTLPFGSVLAVDLNDACAGIDVKAQCDDMRELPCATGVIDLGAFLRGIAARAVEKVPVRVEPFNSAVNGMSDEQTLDAVTESLRRAFALLEQISEPMITGKCGPATSRAT